MDWKELISSGTALLIALGGFEFVKWVVGRKYGRRVDEANADKSEFETLKATNEYLQVQYQKMEELYVEQNNELHASMKRELELVRENTMLKTERALKLCERRMCADRLPQSGY